MVRYNQNDNIQTQEMKKRESNIAVKIQKIGNSKGILLSNSMLSDLGVENETEVMVKSELLFSGSSRPNCLRSNPVS